jgi:hypothetical protein
LPCYPLTGILHVFILARQADMRVEMLLNDG